MPSCLAEPVCPVYLTPWPCFLMLSFLRLDRLLALIEIFAVEKDYRAGTGTLIAQTVLPLPPYSRYLSCGLLRTGRSAFSFPRGPGEGASGDAAVMYRRAASRCAPSLRASAPLSGVLYSAFLALAAARRRNGGEVPPSGVRMYHGGCGRR